MTCTCDICKREYEANSKGYRLDGIFRIFARDTLRKYDDDEIHLCSDCTLWLYDIIHEEKKVYEE